MFVAHYVSTDAACMGWRQDRPGNRLVYSKATSGFQLEGMEGIVSLLCPTKGKDVLKREREKKNLCAVEARYGGWEGKGVNVTSKVLHQGGCIYTVERCQVANLIHLNDIWIQGVEREDKFKKEKGIWV